MADHLRTELALGTLQMAAQQTNRSVQAHIQVLSRDPCSAGEIRPLVSWILALQRSFPKDRRLIATWKLPDLPTTIRRT